MKRKFIFLITLIFALGGVKSSLLNAQEVITIGSGTETSKFFPIYNNEENAITQFYYLASEINKSSGGTITSISFKTANDPGQDSNGNDKYPYTRTLNIYMQNLDDTPNSNTISTIDPKFKVYSGDIEFQCNSWITIELDTPFNYEGGEKGILICVNDNSCSYISNGGTQFCVMSTTGNYRALYKYSRVCPSPLKPEDNKITGCSKKSQVPFIQFTFASGEYVKPDPVITLNNPTGEVFNPSLSFSLTNTEQYKVLFSTTEDFTEGVSYLAGDANNWVSYTSGDVTLPNIENLAPSTPYYWKVIARNGEEEGDPTAEATASFTTKEFGVPGAITNVSPENNAQNLINPVLSWTFGANTEQQQVLIDENIVVDWTNIGTKTNDSYQTSNLAAGTHTWQVNTKNGAGEKTGNAYTFTVASLPDNVTAISPANGATNVSSNKIKWQFAENTTEYRLLVHYGEDTWGWDNGWVYELGNNNTWIPTNGAEEMEFELKSFETSKTYYWAVDVKNSIGIRTVYQGGEEITKFSFTTASTLPVSNTAPANGVTNLENPELQWNYVGNAQQYKVYLGKDENNLEAVTEEWTARESVETGLAGSGSYQTSGLDGATKYFWRVDVKDENGVEIEGEVWSFVTILPVPTNVEANPTQVVPTSSMTGFTTISWKAMDGANGYNVYLGTEKLNAGLITETSFKTAAILEHNMNPGYDFFVQAVYELGESEMSEAANVKVTGSGFFKATIYSNDWGNRLADATVTLTFTEDEFGNVYENGEGGQYIYTTNSNGEAFEELTMSNGETQITTSIRLYNGTYSVVVEKENYDTFNGSVTISNNETSELYETGGQYAGVILHIDSSILFEVILSDVSFESINVNLGSGTSAGQYNVYLRNGDETTDLGMKDFVTGGAGNIYFTYSDWGNLGKGSYLFGVAKVESQINWSDVAFRNYDVFETEGSWSEAANWRDEELPGTNAEVYVLKAATIEDEVNVSTVNIKDGGSLTINGSLTADNVYNAMAGDVIINDGAQLRQNNSSLMGMFNMNIINPTNWLNGNDGWQFIASPFTNANINKFTNVTDGYDLFKFDGTQDKEWVNQKEENDGSDDGDDDGGVGGIERPEETEENSGSRSGDETFETQFVNGRGYLASYEKATSATLSGTINSEQSHTWSVTYTENATNGDLANFHLLGNPFTFDMDWNNVAQKNMIAGYAVLNDNGSGYKYATTGIIKVGDAFFVKTTGTNPTMSYQEAAKRSSNESINLIAKGKAGSDNVIISLSGAENEGFNKLQNFNEGIANIFIAKNDLRYGIANFDNDVTMIDVAFEAKEMGNYTIAAQPNGKFKTLTLVDRFTGVETNLLVEDYNFTATSNDNYNRFIVKLVNGQQTTDNSHFAYVSGEELILSEEGAVEIIDMMGRIVYANDIIGDNNRIDVSAFNNAAYVVRVINENGVKVQKIIL